MSAVNVELLQTVSQHGETGMTKEELLNFAKENIVDVDKADNWVKNFLSNYKSKYQFISETVDGRYVATDSCNKYLDKRKEKALKTSSKQLLLPGSERPEG